MYTEDALLYIEPISWRSTEPVIDTFTLKMLCALHEAKSSGRTGVLGIRDGIFRSGVVTRGRHVCRCGELSSNVDYQLANGETTNSLAVHYLIWHREEVTLEQLERVDQLLSRSEVDEYCSHHQDELECELSELGISKPINWIPGAIIR